MQKSAAAIPEPLTMPSGTQWPWKRSTCQAFRRSHVNKLPRITLVMPSYNQARYLEVAIRSVLLQDYENLEYIVLDGGSTDGSVDIIKHYSSYISRWESKPDGGQAAALWRGFNGASGEIFCWLNSDDMLLPGTLRYVGEVMSRRRGVEFLYGNRLVIDDVCRVVDRHVWPFLITRWHWGSGQPVAQECCFWRAALYRRVGGVDPEKYFIMDYDLFVRMWQVARFTKSTRLLGCLRLHSDSKNTKDRSVWIEELDAARLRYGLEPARGVWARVLNRLDRLQIAGDRLINRFSNRDALGNEWDIVR